MILGETSCFASLGSSFASPMKGLDSFLENLDCFGWPVGAALGLEWEDDKELFLLYFVLEVADPAEVADKAELLRFLSIGMAAKSEKDEDFLVEENKESKPSFLPCGGVELPEFEANAFENLSATTLEVSMFVDSSDTDSSIPLERDWLFTDGAADDTIEASSGAESVRCRLVCRLLWPFRFFFRCLALSSLCLFIFCCV